MTASSPMTVTSGYAPVLTAGTTANTSHSPPSPLSSTSSLSDGDGGESERERSASLTPLPEDTKPSKKKPAASANGKATKATKAAASTVAKPRASLSKATPKAATTGAKRKSLAATEADNTPKKKTKMTQTTLQLQTPKKGTPAKSTKDEEEEKPEKGTYCHQCRTKCEPDAVLRCTRLRKYTKHSAPRACNLAWCERDLEKRYDIIPSDVQKRGLNVSADELAKHDTDKGYIFGCPCCLDECQNATCRQKKGLPRLGDVVKFAAEEGISPLEYVRRINEQGPQPTGKSREDVESDLTDIDAPVKKKKVLTLKIKTPEKKKATSASKTAVKIAPKGAKGKDAKNTKDAAKKDTKKGGKEVKKEIKEVKVKKEPEEKPVDPPLFNMVNAKLSYDDVEHRLYLREFVNRFRGLLRIPDRSIAHLDDFDHPLNEAVVRHVAGGLLDLVVEDAGQSTGVDEETIEVVSDKREELRHYADLARFAQVYKEIAEPLGLKMLEVESAKDRNDRAMRVLLDLGENDPAPSWAYEAAPSRRAAASRLPSASEVVRMLIALTEHVIYIDAVRSTMDPAVGNTYADHLRKNQQDNRAENSRWETEKKGILAARVRCKSAEQTKANKAKYDAEYAEHNMRLRAGQVALNIVQGRKLTKFAPLGTDPDGRLYFALTPRLIDDERYRPSGWTRGVMVWGPGIEAQDGQDELPTMVPRWSHFSTALDARQLALWLGWRVRKAVRDAEADEAKRAKETAAAAKRATKKGASGASTVNGTPTPAMNGKQVTPTPRRTSQVFDGVVLPNRGKRTPKRDGDDSDAESELSDAPETREDLLALLDPPGYIPSVDKVKEGHGLVGAVEQVAALLEVLEWKGYA